MSKMNYTRIAQNRMDELFCKHKNNISDSSEIMNELHSELAKSYFSKDIMAASDKLKELIGLEKDNMDIDLQIAKFKEKFQKKGMELSDSDMKQKLKPWLENEQNPQAARRNTSHDFILKICGVFDMNIAQTEEFIAKAFFRRAFYKNIHDTAIFFCINNGIDCKEWDNICDLCEKELKKCNVYECEENPLYTSYLYEQLSEVTNIQGLYDFIHQHAEGLQDGYTMEMARQEVDRLLTLATNIVNKIKRENEFESYDTVSDNRFKHKNNPDIKVSPKYNPYVLLNFPSKASINKIKNGKGSYDSIRKALILLHFFIFMSDEANQRATPEKRFEKYYFEANVLMSKCGFPRLWIMNPYEKLFMYCVHHESPLEIFRAFVSDMYGVDDGADVLKNKKVVYDTNTKSVIDIIYGFDTNKIQKNVLQ